MGTARYQKNMENPCFWMIFSTGSGSKMQQCGSAPRGPQPPSIILEGGSARARAQSTGAANPRRGWVPCLAPIVIYRPSRAPRGPRARKSPHMGVAHCSFLLPSTVPKKAPGRRFFRSYSVHSDTWARSFPACVGPLPPALVPHARPRAARYASLHIDSKVGILSTESLPPPSGPTGPLAPPLGTVEKPPGQRGAPGDRRRGPWVPWGP